MRQKNKISVFSLMFIFLSAFAGFADFNLGEIVVRPYDYGHEMEELPFSSSIITWNEIENSNIFSYSNSLENLPGVKVHRTGNFGRADIQIRGRGDRGRQIITLVNGRPELMGLFGCTITNSLPIENIQRIEVIRGPASVLYGSNSLGGAVNIVTRDEMKKGFNTVIRTSAGSFNSHRQRLRQSGRIDNFAYTFTGGLNASAGFRENSAYESQSYTLGTRYRLTDSSQLSLRGAYYNGTKEYPEPSNNKRVEYERASVEADYEFKKVKGDHALKVYRNFGDHLFDNGNNFNDYTNGLLLNSAFDFSKKDKLNAGVEVRQMGGEHMRANMKIGGWEKYEFALFSLYRRKLGEKLRLSAGARYSIDEVARDVFLTQAGATYRISDNTILRLIRSEGFRYPQINDLYMFGASNESLEPETSANHEIGLLQKLGKGAYGDISIYNMIGEADEEKFDFRGLEFSFNAPIGGISNARISYTFLDPGKFTQGRPGNKLNAALYFELEKTYAALNAKHVSSYYSKDSSKGKIDDYLVLSLQLNYNLLNNLKIFSEIDNLMDESYSIYADIPGGAGVYPMPGRSFSLGLGYEF